MPANALVTARVVREWENLILDQPVVRAYAGVCVRDRGWVTRWELLDLAYVVALATVGVTA